MKWILAAAVAAGGMLALCSAAASRPMLYDPIALNIGVNCQWQPRCMAAQRTAMKRALAYVSSRNPPRWRVQVCNRNAGRGGYRVDWVGFDHCIRNPNLKRPRGIR
jgi:hypothetical protein